MRRKLPGSLRASPLRSKSNIEFFLSNQLVFCPIIPCLGEQARKRRVSVHLSHFAPEFH